MIDRSIATRFGDANENGNYIDATMDGPGAQLNGTRRRSTRFRRSNNQQQDPPVSGDQIQSPHSVAFKPFTSESLLNIQRRKAQKTKKQSSAFLDLAKPALEPDPYLVSGQQLPPALIRQLPPELIGKPIEDIDPYYADQDTFVIISRGKELTRFSATKALCILGPFHPIRRAVLYILVNPIFNSLVILTILTNCILMTFQGNELVERTEIIFTIVYTTEMGLKVLARGFIVDQFTYLHDPWNWLDFLVIIMAYLTIVIQDLGNLSVIRTFRVLRALKTVAIVPGMKTIVGALIDSVKNLRDVVVLTLFSLSVFSLLGLQIYMGQLTQKCILNGPSNMTDTEWFQWCSDSSHWVPEPDDEIFGAHRLCGNATGAQTCSGNHTCIQGFGPNPDYGYTNFDTFGWALICSFRLMTQDFWEGLYMQVLKTAGSWHIIFFIVSIFLGSIYLMNLILAIVAMSYNELQRRAEEEEEAAAEDEAVFLESCRMMEMQDQLSEFSGNTNRSARSSYRPSVEIGLVGQSLLASLCQNGLLSQQVREKLNQQMALPELAQPTARSHSLSVNFENRHLADRHPMDKRLDSTARGQGLLTSAQYLDRPPIAASMTDLRRKSSVRLRMETSPNPSNGKTTQPDPTPPNWSLSPVTGGVSMQNQSLHPHARHGYDRSRPQAGQSNKLSPRHVSSSVLMSLPRSDQNSSGTLNRSSMRSPRCSTTSDRDLQVLKQRAAVIRIVSIDGLNHPIQEGNNLTKDPAQMTVSLDSSSTQDESDHTEPQQPRHRYRTLSTRSRGSLLDYPVSPSHPTGIQSARASMADCRDHDERFLYVDPQSENSGRERQGYRGSVTDTTSTRSNQLAVFRSGFRSEASICQQPSSIHFMARGMSKDSYRKLSSVSNAPSEPIDEERVDARSTVGREYQVRIDDSHKRHKIGASTRTLHSNAYSGSTVKSYDSHLIGLALPSADKDSKMHHLSVENFQQFSAVPNQKYQQAPEFNGNSVIQQRQMCHRLESRGHIHPTTMVRSSFARPRQSVAIGGHYNGTQNSRRVSKDFVRRASDWSRMSMSNNLDMRRLLRLWMHTNPYNQNNARPSIGSLSNYSNQIGVSTAFGSGANFGSPAHSIKGAASQSGSHRPSSVGSAWQAYELISAMSRRQTRYENLDPRYAIPLDDNMMDKMSVNFRDKSVAYCLSCLDILCIWECCGAWLKIQKLISIIVFDPFTELFIILCILINTLFMALDSDDADSQMRSIFERGNYFFTATFAVEASMKIMALSPKFYFREGWNVFDSIIVSLSLLELGLEGVYGLSVLRSFRLLRVFKLAKSWPTLNLLISIMGKAVGDLGNLTFVLAIIVFIFAVTGMQLFGNKYVDRNFPSGELPRWNFTDFMHSFMIVFRILCAEWIEPMWDCLLVGGWPCIPFFLIAVTVGNLVVLNLFLALLLASFGASNLSSPQADNVDTKKLQEAIARFSRFGRWIRRRVGGLLRRILRLILCSRKSNLSKDISSARYRESSAIHDGNYSSKSHIVTMSRLERLKNIEMRTEQLKNKIRRSPEHHYHLKHLAKSQLKASTKRPSSVSGYNYNYKSRAWPQSATGSNRYDDRGADDSATSSPIPMIPIIVNEPELSDSDHQVLPVESTSLCSRNEASEHNSDGKDSPFDEMADSFAQSVSLALSSSPIQDKVAETSTFDESRNCQSATDAAPNRQGQKIFMLVSGAKAMQPIIEDSKDGDSMHDDVAQREPFIDGRKSSTCDKLAMAPVVQSDSSNRICLADDAVSSVSDQEAKRSGLYLEPPMQQEMEEDDEKTLQHIETYIESCICIGIVCLKWFLFRQYVRKIVEHRYFDQCILVLIVISSGTLALEDKHLNERPTLKRTLDVLDTVFTIIFSLEMILKWLAFGIRRYFGNIWSWLDFVIVLVSFINLMASVFGSGKIQALKTMRTLRAMRGLRPLRALQRFQGMRVVVNALIQAIPSIFNVLLVCLIFWLIFSIMGVQMFGGKFWRCLSPETRQVVSYEEAANRVECIERNLTWANPQINFDNVLNAYLALFQVATFKGWIDIMNSATDSRMRDDQPIREANIYMYLYFVFFVIFGSFFTLNLFIGVIIDNFNEQKRKTGGSLEIFMTEDQKKYYHAMKKMRSKRPVKAMTRPKMKLQAYTFDIVTSKNFDMAIMLIIGLNMFVMALEHYGQSQDFSSILENLNLFFIAVFTIECLAKIFAMRHFYFREPWNVFDFIVVDLSIVGVVMKEYVAKYFVSPTLLRVVRVVKVGRVLRLVKGAKGIRTLLFALAMSLPALFNICLLLFLVMFIYAIFGMSFFMNVRHRSGIDETFNFETFTSSIIVLFQMSTSAGWDLVLDPLMDEENDCQKPDPSQGIEGTCGNKEIAIFYLISYVIVTFLIIINMYIAVILENYSQATEDVQEGLTDDDYEMYYEIWQRFDPDGTQYLPYSKLSDFVDALEDPLRIPKPNDLALVVLDINIYQGDRCYCVDILDALTKHFFTRKGLVIQVNEHLQKVQSTLHETPFERITTTYLLKRQHYCAKVIQNCWRKWRARARRASKAS